LNERDIVESALERNARNMAATSRELGISRVTLYRLVRRLGIRR
jgi:transcriptional regulator of acetoin/glycerol metabolism